MSAARINNYSLLLWVVSPFLSLVITLCNLDKRYALGMLLLASFYFGFSFVVSTTGADSQRYGMQLQEMHSSNLSFVELVGNFYTDEDSKIDIYQPLMTWLVSVFTGEVKFLFALFATVFGYFWFQSFFLVRNQFSGKLSLFWMLVLVVILLTNPIWNINGVRMWTAVQVFVYGVLLVELSGKKHGYYFCVGALFVHFSLSVMLVWYVLFKILPFKNINLLFIGFIASFFVSELNLELIQNYFSLLPDFLQSRKTYVSDASYEAMIENSSGQGLAAHVILFQNIQKYFVLMASVYLFLLQKRRIVILPLFKQLFALTLFVGLFANFASNLPSGGRFLMVSNLLMFISLFLSASIQSKIPLLPKIVFSGIMIFIIVYQIRVGFDYTGALFFIGNPIVMFFVEDTVPAIDFVKSLL